MLLVVLSCYYDDDTNKVLTTKHEHGDGGGDDNDGDAADAESESAATAAAADDDGVADEKDGYGSLCEDECSADGLVVMVGITAGLTLVVVSDGCSKVMGAAAAVAVLSR